MSETVIAYDLGTGGIKASLFRVDGRILASVFVAYDTFHPCPGWNEQRPDDWWKAVVESTSRLLNKEAVDRTSIVALAISGHSLGVVPMGEDGTLLRDMTPIWSDQRATAEADDFFSRIDYKEWYMTTGNGFPPACYSVFKMMWYKKHEPAMFSSVKCVIGTKDYCNYRFTGRLATDPSYASGSGVFDLGTGRYREDYMTAAGLDAGIFPEIIPSDAIVGEITHEAAAETGLPLGVKIICGGVDNSCMALGARGIKDSRVYTSLGSSAWIALVSSRPVLDFERKPYVFAHVIPGMYASATCIFSAGTSFQWVRNNMCRDLLLEEQTSGKDVYQSMNEEIESVPPGAHGLLFNPSLAGGSMLEPSPMITGGFMGLRLEHSRSDLLRAAQEGIALNLRIALDLLRSYHPVMERMLIVGGGAKSEVWMQIFADAYRMAVEKTSIDQEAASLGAAALAWHGIGAWTDYNRIDELHIQQKLYEPNDSVADLYEQMLPRFSRFAQFLSFEE